ncbi:hypothetical protein KXD93_14940 [Mucilaginibacter sp. BJC16-A38]|uniref:hypothetical protein n=1 Tax=Mucilaginibacter phenanthrenivorans TaxID=1234842 RepID=UPI002157C9FF|nr:hypothetical protein [Mucilaginibacter phenanthrenivorans]MCR8558951.1 hypothetical protein [Mucilaginibacter phenanthrenivorans]
MKKRVIYLIMVAASAFAYSSCKTSSDPTPAKPTYKFTVNGTTYTETAGADSATSISGEVKNLNALGITGQSADKSAQAAIIFFWKGTARPKAGTYTVVGDVSKMTAGQVGALVIDKVTVAKQGLYGTTGLDGTSITVVVSAAGKISVTMPSIVIKGTNFDNTDPKNTVTTDVTGTISGSGGE